MAVDHESYMRIALEEARAGIEEGEQPFGAVVVHDRHGVVARTHSLKVGTCDATAHAETRAIGLATRALGRRELGDCTFYSVCEPCPMCGGAMINTHVRTLVLGARIPALIASLGQDVFGADYTIENLVKMTGSAMQVVTGVLEEECASLYRDLGEGQTSR